MHIPEKAGKLRKVFFQAEHVSEVSAKLEPHDHMEKRARRRTQIHDSGPARGASTGLVRSRGRGPTGSAAHTPSPLRSENAHPVGGWAQHLELEPGGQAKLPPT